MSTAVATGSGHTPPSLCFLQAEYGIRDKLVTGVQTCALPICSCSPMRGSERSWPRRRRSTCSTSSSDRKSVVEGKSVDLGGRRIIKKKNIQRETHDESGGVHKDRQCGAETGTRG